MTTSLLRKSIRSGDFELGSLIMGFGRLKFYGGYFLIFVI